MSFYGLGGESLWTTDEMRIGYPIPANASFLVVASVDGAVEHSKHVSGDDTSAVVDGAPIPLDDPLSNEHTVRVVVYSDENGNERFDPGTDRPCLADGDVVQAGPRVVDFDRIADAES